MEIVPALEEFDKDSFSKKLDKLADFAKRIQVDFNDGSFLGTTTVKPADVIDVSSQVSSRVYLEAHLMVQRPLDYVSDLTAGGFRKVLLEAEVEDDLRSLLEKLLASEMDLGLAFGPDVDPIDLEPYFGLVGTMNVMAIYPGKQGQELLPTVVPRIGQLRELGFGGEIEVDGGINDSTIGIVAPFRPDTLIVGSFIVSAESPRERFDRLTEIIKSNMLKE